MSSLFRAELLRLVSRRLLVVLLVCMAGTAAFSSAVLADYVSPVSEAEQRQAEEYLAEEKQYFEESECGEIPTSDLCDGVILSDGVESYIRTPSTYGEYTRLALDLGIAFMLLAVGVLAASLVGAEFSSGNIATQLLFTPRRTPMLLSKVVAATVGALLLAITYLGTLLAFTAIMFLALRGAGDMTAGIELPLSLGRALVLAALIAIMAVSLTMASGSTLVTLGIFAVVLIASEVVKSVISAFSLSQFLFPSNVLLAMIAGKAEIYGWTEGDYGQGVLAHVINYDWALGYSVVGTAIIVAASAWLFRRRDILT